MEFETWLCPRLLGQPSGVRHPLNTPNLIYLQPKRMEHELGPRRDLPEQDMRAAVGEEDGK